MTGRPPGDRDRASPAERRRRFERERRRRFRDQIRIQAETEAEIRALLKQADDSIVAQLARGASEFTTFRLRQLQASIRAVLADVERNGAAALDRGLVRSWDAGVAQVDAPLAAAGLDIGPRLTNVDPRVLYAMREFMTDRMKAVTADITNRVNVELGQALIGVRTPFETAQRVSAIVGEGGLKRALVITRTELGRAYSIAAQERMVQAKELVPDLKKQWRRSGKVHARFEHQAIDGQVQDVDKPFKLGNGVTLMHPRDPKAPPSETINCGCTALPWKKSWSMTTPGRQPITDREADASRQLRLLRDADLPSPAPPPPLATTAPGRVEAPPGTPAFARFLTGEVPGYVELGRLPDDLMRPLGIRDPGVAVRLSQATLRSHMIADGGAARPKHPEADADAYANVLPVLLEEGRAFLQTASRPGERTRVNLVATVRGNLWTASIKGTARDGELFLTSFRRTKEPDVARLARRDRPIRRGEK